MLCIGSATMNKVKTVISTNLSWFSSWVRSVLTGLTLETVLTGGMLNAAYKKQLRWFVWALLYYVWQNAGVEWWYTKAGRGVSAGVGSEQEGWVVGVSISPPISRTCKNSGSCVDWFNGPKTALSGKVWCFYQVPDSKDVICKRGSLLCCAIKVVWRQVASGTSQRA